LVKMTEYYFKFPQQDLQKTISNRPLIFLFYYNFYSMREVIIAEMQHDIYLNEKKGK